MLDAAETRDLNEAGKLVEALLESRRDWDEVYKVQSEINALQNDPVAMIASLREAQSKGELEPHRLRQLATLYFQTGDHVNARAVLKQLEDRGDQSLFKLNFQVLLQEGKKDEAAKLLDTYRLKSGAPPEESLWQAQALRQVGKADESERLLYELIADDQKIERPEAWMALLSVLRDQKKENEARQLLNRLRNLPESETQCLVVARAAETLEDAALAQQSYAKAVQRDPQALRPRRELAGYYIRAKVDQMAIRELNTLIELCAKKSDDPQATEFSEWAQTPKSSPTSVADGSATKTSRSTTRSWARRPRPTKPNPAICCCVSVCCPGGPKPKANARRSR
ncbi:MAG: hypothetical protein QM811_24530 [Pirellulales bacterium]